MFGKCVPIQYAGSLSHNFKEQPFFCATGGAGFRFHPQVLLAVNRTFNCLCPNFCERLAFAELRNVSDFSAPYLPHGHMSLLVSEQVDVHVGADVGWPLEVDVVFPETFHGVERSRLVDRKSKHM